MTGRVGCAGIIVEDTFCGPLAELPPEGQLVAVENLPVRAGGCAANVAIGLARQEIAVEIAGCVGRDSAGEGLLRVFQDLGIGHQRLTTFSDLPTSKTVILLMEGQDRRYIHSFGANRGFTAATLEESWLKSLDLLYLGGVFALPGLPNDALADILIFCRENKVQTLLDVVIPGGTAEAQLAAFRPLMPLIDWFLPNEDEAGVLSGCEETKDQADWILAQGVGTVIITRGKDGALAAKGNERWQCGSHAISGVDPSGAGDAFTCGVIASLLAGRTMPDLLQYASAMGASATRSVGTTDGIFSRADAEAWVAAHPLPVTYHRVISPSQPVIP